ncbi:aminopeptidase P family protein [Magnetovibrio sp.]|uniref:aminopeptidase P family protein n=1 Tax=Magnetovibrio sp. TaxID=2024836 RepID=UPI002F92C0A8
MSLDPLDVPIARDPELCTKLRARLRADDFVGFVVPHSDANQSEYLPPSAERLARLTGFGGSAGLAIVMQDEAAIFVDGRYTLQVRDEVDATVFAPQPIATVKPEEWLRTRLKPGDRLAYDPWLHTPGQLEPYAQVCADTQSHLVAVAENPIDALWPDRPAPPSSPLVVLDTPFAPLTSKAKRALVGADLQKAGVDAAVISAGDSIAWLFNIRANDVPFTPLVLAYALINADGTAKLFIDDARVDAATRAHLGPDVEIVASDRLSDVLDALGRDKKAVRIATRATPAWIVERVTKAGARILPGDDPCQLPKAKKTPAEIDGIKRAHKRDGAALVRFLAWLSVEGPKGGVTELSAAAKLDGQRAANEHFRGLSFPTISGSGPNGAIVHYRVSEQSDRALRSGELYLVDSGAQYLDGTTDVTRTVAIGKPTAEMRDRFTRVLKGHIAISSQTFPRGTRGQELDVLARRALWEAGIDYDHGTGHGVGTYLGVHEGPQGISKRGQGPELAAGMVLSNEPGYYKEGAFGIRIENLIYVRDIPAPRGAEREMLGFEPLTLAPIDRTLIDADLLTPSERAWINAYHARVFAELSALVDGETHVWLAAATAPLL